MPKKKNIEKILKKTISGMVEIKSPPLELSGAGIATQLAALKEAYLTGFVQAKGVELRPYDISTSRSTLEPLSEVIYYKGNAMVKFTIEIEK